MSDCEKTKKLLSPYIDGELKGEEKEEVRKHLLSCSSCRELHSLFVKIGEETANVTAPDKKTIEESLKEARRKLGIEKKSWGFPLLRPALGLGILGLLIFALYSGIPGLKTREKPVLPGSGTSKLMVSEMSEDELELLMLIDEAGGSEEELLEILKTLEDLEEILESDRREA